MTVSDKDMGWKALGERLDKLADGTAYVLVGVQGSEGDAQHGEDGLTNVQLATIHEFGLGVPERSFIRATIEEHQRDLAKFITKLGQRVVVGELTEEYALSVVGEYAVGLIKARIKSRIDPPNRPSTIARKGTDVPLIEKSTLWSSITYRLWSQT